MAVSGERSPIYLDTCILGAWHTVVDIQQTLADWLRVPYTPTTLVLASSHVFFSLERNRNPKSVSPLPHPLSPSPAAQCSLCLVCPMHLSIPLTLTSVELRDGNGPSKYTCHLVTWARWTALGVGVSKLMRINKANQIKASISAFSKTITILFSEQFCVDQKLG